MLPGASQGLNRLLCCMQGHFQIILNPTRSPLVQWKLRLFDRLMYCSGCWSYTVGAITTPVFIAIPFLTIWIGAQPLLFVQAVAGASRPSPHYAFLRSHPFLACIFAWPATECTGIAKATLVDLHQACTPCNEIEECNVFNAVPSAAMVTRAV